MTTIANAPSNPWVVNDGGVVGTSEFLGRLQRAGYVRAGVASFTGVEVDHYRRFGH